MHAFSRNDSMDVIWALWFPFKKMLSGLAKLT